MLGLRCRFSALDLGRRFDTPTKLSYLLTLYFDGATLWTHWTHFGSAGSLLILLLFLLRFKDYFKDAS